MKRLLCGLLGGVFALMYVSAFACTAEKAKDAGQMSTPAKPKT